MGTALESPFITPDEAANYLRLEARTLNNMRWRGEGPRYRKHGGKVIYHIKDLQVWSRNNDCGFGPKHSDFTSNDRK